MTALDIISPELDQLPGVRPKPIFGHKGFAIGTSVFAFLDDDDTLVVKTEKHPTPESLPKDLTHFWAGEALMKTWVKIPITDDLKMIRRHWELVLESYEHAAIREKLKKKKGK
jgi:hypothetical protein